MELHLMRPEWLWALLPALMLAALLWRQRDRHGSWSQVIAAGAAALPGEPRGAGPAPNLLPCYPAGLDSGRGGRQRPQLAESCHSRCTRSRTPWCVVLDLSYSMKSADLAPSRLDRARQKILDLLAHRAEGQTGLIAYAGDAHIVTPLTDDTATIANLLPALSPDMMPVPGSDAAAPRCRRRWNCCTRRAFATAKSC